MPWGLTRFHHSGQSHFVTFCCYHRRRTGGPLKPGFGLSGEQHFLAKEVLRFQRSQLSAVCGEAALYSSQSGGAGIVRTSGGLAVEQFSPLRNGPRGTGRDRVRMDGTKTRTSGGKTWSSVRTPEEWKWSSYRHYALRESGVVEIESQWTARDREGESDGRIFLRPG